MQFNGSKLFLGKIWAFLGKHIVSFFIIHIFCIRTKPVTRSRSTRVGPRKAFLFPNFMLLRETVGKFIAGTEDSQTRVLFYIFELQTPESVQY